VPSAAAERVNKLLSAFLAIFVASTANVAVLIY
jgi:hypothetical protein